MNRKRQLKATSQEATPNAVWKLKPPGPEQHELERMFKSNEISPSASADTIRKSSEMFQRFSAQVFGNHFRATKAKLGGCGNIFYILLMSEAPTESKLIITARVSDASGDAGGTGIPELGEQPLSHREDSPEFEPQRSSSIDFLNPPYWVWKYFDHEKDLEFICIAVVALSGIRDVDFHISEDGMTVHIWYIWPTAIYKFDELFRKSKDDDNTQLRMNHPKVHAYVANCLDNGVSRHSMPKGQIVVQLPQKVQRFPNTYKIEAVDIDGTHIVQITFSAQPKAAVIETADRSIVFK